MGKEDYKPQGIVPVTSQPVHLVTKPGAQVKPKQPFLQYVFIFLGCFVGIVCSQIFLAMMMRSPEPPSPPQPPKPFDPNPIEQAKRDVAEKLANPHLAWAENECTKAIDHNIQIIKDLFDHSKTKTRSYTDYALGMYSKWLLIKDYIPFTSKSHGPYLKSEFEKQVLSPAVIETAVNECVKNHIKSIRDIESQMLIRIKKDAPNYPDITVLRNLDIATLDSYFGKKLVDEASKSATTDSGIDAGRLLASEVASFVAIKVAAAIAAKMTTTGVIAGVATTSGPYTFGISIVAGIVVDQIVGWVWDWYADPKGNLSKKLNETLDQMCEGVINGTDAEPGLRKLLIEMNVARFKLQRRTTMDILVQ